MAGRFTSRDPDHPPHSATRILRWGVVDRLLGERVVRPPGPPAPRVEPDLARLRRPATAPRLTWIGHASVLLQWAGRGVLVDPVISGRLGIYRRHVAPGLRVDQLPDLHLLLLTHSHYDHLDEPTLRRLPRELRVAVPLGLGPLLRRLGFADVHELDWWQAVDAGPLRATLVPARHWSRRGLLDVNDTLWGGWVVQAAGERRAVYHAGDSAYFPGFAEIGERFPGLDVAILPIGAYDPAWFMEYNHLNPEQAGRAYLDLGARTLVPVHWGTYQLTDEPLAEPPGRLGAWFRRHRPPGRLAVPAVGETIGLG